MPQVFHRCVQSHKAVLLLSLYLFCRLVAAGSPVRQPPQRKKEGQLPEQTASCMYTIFHVSASISLQVCGPSAPAAEGGFLKKLRIVQSTMTIYNRLAILLQGLLPASPPSGRRAASSKSWAMPFPLELRRRPATLQAAQVGFSERSQSKLRHRSPAPLASLDGLIIAVVLDTA